MLEFINVWKTYKKEMFHKIQPACQDVSFSISPGETLGLIGANGAGKSTCIKLLMDFIRPDSGKITIFNAFSHTINIRSRIGYLPEIAHFPANLSVLDLLRFTCATCGISSEILKQRSYELLTLLGLWEVRRRPLRSYSKGMQQRANFAIALINDPDLLILDEPMSGLDPIGRKRIIDLINQLKKNGKTILFCSHILEDVDRLADSVLLLHKGKKLFFGTPRELANEEDAFSIAEAFVCKVTREEENVR